MDDPQQNRKDVEHLRQLAIFHFVGAGLAFLGICFVGLHYMIFRTVFADPALFANAKGGPPPEQFFAIFKIFYVVAVVWFLKESTKGCVMLSGVKSCCSGVAPSP